eukprot:751362-Hanusia_phi.AAC.5
MVSKIFKDSGNEVVIEELLEGEEASYFALCDGETAIPVAGNDLLFTFFCIESTKGAQDHKQVYDGDKGPNTGGMGAYSPAPVLTPEMEQKVDVEHFGEEKDRTEKLC